MITRRAGREACRQVGENARAVSQVAGEFGVCWWTVMNAVIEHGTPLVDDPDRVGPVSQLGVDETSFLKATAEHATIYATGLVDLVRHRLIDMVEGNSAGDLRNWAGNADPGGSHGSKWWPPTWPSRSGPDCRRTSITVAASPTRSTSCGSGTAVSTRSDAACRTRRSSSWPQARPAV